MKFGLGLSNLNCGPYFVPICKSFAVHMKYYYVHATIEALHTQKAAYEIKEWDEKRET